MEAQQQGALWAGSPLLKQRYHVDPYGHVERTFPQLDAFMPTEVVVDTPVLNVNKSLKLQESIETPFPIYMSQPPNETSGLFDTGTE